ncbi:protein kinase domain-containing protein [Corallococcus llansteffanensis]|uniref:Protein kinase domain-containing protein n=1 Tax=Corallococcus llansteffanensis TaxID=2316731 RepID=A0A3A8NVF4_9BACT|nr:protein kinase [Corallococcus llansteffanensis]RKH47180.1 hypothetical protein D7V93_34150 [Corallococcus llansteffanensis]
MRLQLGALTEDSAKALALELARHSGGTFDDAEILEITTAITGAIPAAAQGAPLVQLDPMKVLQGLDVSTAKAKVLRFCLAARKTYQPASATVVTVVPTSGAASMPVVPQPGPSAPPLPRQVGPWTFTNILLGAGGFGRVYLAREGTSLLAVKQLTNSEEARLEYEAMRGLKHPAIPIPLRVFQSFLALEYINGDSLRKHAPMPPWGIRVVGAQIASALTYLHAQGRCHADIKLANIMLDRVALARKSANCVKLIDFGLARRVNVSEGQGPYLADIRMLGRVLFQLAMGPDAEPPLRPLSAPRLASIGPRLAQVINLCLHAGPATPVTALGVHRHLHATSAVGGYQDA